METMNVFTGDAYSKFSLTEQINRIPHKPGLIGAMGLFERQGIATPFLGIEEKDGTFNIIKTSARGQEGNRRRNDKRRVRRFEVPHLEEFSRIYADDITGTRLYGEMPGSTSDAAKGTIVAQRMTDMVADHDVTLEYHRVGAIKGEVLDSDDSVLFNWHEEYGITKEVIPYDGGASVKLAQVCRELKRNTAKVLGHLSNGGKPVLRVLVGADFMDAIASDDTVKDDYRRWEDGKRNLENAANESYEYQGVEFLEYFGYKDGATPLIAANKGHSIPLGTNLFKTRDACPDTWEGVGTIGLPVYAELNPEKKYAQIDTQSNPINICTKPGVLIELDLS